MESSIPNLPPSRTELPLTQQHEVKKSEEADEIEIEELLQQTFVEIGQSFSDQTTKVKGELVSNVKDRWDNLPSFAKNRFFISEAASFVKDTCSIISETTGTKIHGLALLKPFAALKLKWNGPGIKSDFETCHKSIKSGDIPLASLTGAQGSQKLLNSTLNTIAAADGALRLTSGYGVDLPYIGVAAAAATTLKCYREFVSYSESTKFLNNLEEEGREEEILHQLNWLKTLKEQMTLTPAEIITIQDAYDLERKEAKLKGRPEPSLPEALSRSRKLKQERLTAGISSESVHFISHTLEQLRSGVEQGDPQAIEAAKAALSKLLLEAPQLAKDLEKASRQGNPLPQLLWLKNQISLTPAEIISLQDAHNLVLEDAQLTGKPIPSFPEILSRARELKRKWIEVGISAEAMRIISHLVKEILPDVQQGDPIAIDAAKEALSLLKEEAKKKIAEHKNEALIAGLKLSGKIVKIGAAATMPTLAIAAELLPYVGSCLSLLQTLKETGALTDTFEAPATPRQAPEGPPPSMKMIKE